MEKIHLQQVLPADIEKRSFEIITEELLSRGKADAILPENELVVKRVIHTTADFDYVDNLCISEGAVQKGMQALKNGACIVTDTQMARSGINKKKLAQFGGEVFCFISDEDVAAQAKQQGTTRATASMEKATKLDRPLIFAIGNAPTALVKLNELMEQGLRPELIIGVPVGFVNVVEAKELILRAPVPYIVARGRKGGSNVAAVEVYQSLLQPKSPPAKCGRSAPYPNFRAHPWQAGRTAAPCSFGSRPRGCSVHPDPCGGTRLQPAA